MRIRLIKYNNELLEFCLKRDSAELIGEYIKLHQKIVISFICNCGKSGSKRFRNLYNGGKAYCKECTNDNYVLKLKLINNNKTIEQKNESIQKYKATCIEKYGTEFPFKNEIIKDKIKASCFKKYGVENAQQSQEVQEKAQKNAKKFKEYKFPSNTIRKVQGYEPFALDELIKSFTEDQIKTDRKDVPRVQYELLGKKKYYFPDIYIPHINTIIEVKSIWTYTLHPNRIEAKAKACRKKGYLYETWIYSKNGTKLLPPFSF